jgi:hypothetical protein
MRNADGKAVAQSPMHPALGIAQKASRLCVQAEYEGGVNHESGQGTLPP